MRNHKTSRQQSYCHACGLIVIDSVCPYCSSTIDEPVIYESKSLYQSRFMSIVGVFLLIVAGVTPAVVSARESTEAATKSSPTVVVSTTTSTAPVIASTSTTLSNSIAKDEIDDSKSSTSQKSRKKESSSSGTLYVAPVVTTTTTTTTTLPPHASGKKRISSILWKSPDSQYAITLNVDTTLQGDDAYLTTSFPTRYSATDTTKCDGGVDDFTKHEGLISLDGGKTASKYGSNILDKCLDARRAYVSNYGNFRDGRWHAGYSELVTAPVSPFHIKIRHTFLRTGEVFESPWVLVDWSTIP